MMTPIKDTLNIKDTTEKPPNNGQSLMSQIILYSIHDWSQRVGYSEVLLQKLRLGEKKTCIGIKAWLTPCPLSSTISLGIGWVRIATVETSLQVHSLVMSIEIFLDGRQVCVI